jgi:hypothetical protein
MVLTAGPGRLKTVDEDTNEKRTISSSAWWYRGRMESKKTGYKAILFIVLVTVSAYDVNEAVH